MAEQIGSNRARMNLENVQGCTGGILRGENVEITGVTSDTRAVEPGNLFVALRGEKFDGHDFLEEAKTRGAVALVVETATDILPSVQVENSLVALGDIARWHKCKVRFAVDMANDAAWWKFPLIAVTGSYGKTSTRALIHAALSAGGETLTSRANFNNEIGLPMALFQLESKHQFAVLEMGMRGRGQIEYLAKIAEPTVGVITNIGPQHIELLGSIENIAQAKAELIENLPAAGLAVLPADSPFLPMLRDKSPCCAVTFGASEDADYCVTNVKTRDDGNVSFAIVIRSGATALFQSRQSLRTRLEENVSPAASEFRVNLLIPGAHNALNAAAAFAVAHQLGVAPDAIVAALATAQLPGARMHVIKTQQLTIIDDCYNAGPDSMRAALETLRDFPGAGRRVAVLGAMRELGDYSDEEHRKLGELASQICDFVVGVGPETEPMMGELRESGHQLFGWSPDAAGAPEVVLSRLQVGDVILVKGSRSVGLEVVVEALLNLV